MHGQTKVTTATAVATPTTTTTTIYIAIAIANQPKRCKCVRQNSLGIDVTATTITPIAATNLN